MLRKIISGGQTGADIAGLEVAKKFGLETGGLMPFGYKTYAGPRPEYKDLYGVEAHSSSSYVPRTRANVRNSDGTMRLALDFASAGEICTKKAIDDYKKSWMDVDLNQHTSDDGVDLMMVAVARTWLFNANIEVLNIAGNREREHGPSVHKRVTQFLTALLDGLPEWMDDYEVEKECTDAKAHEESGGMDSQD